MNVLENYFNTHKGRLIHKWKHYFEVYDRHFHPYRNKKPVILEIGVSQGGSLQMWKDYFGPGAVIYGVDINPICKNFEEDNINIFIGSQEDRSFLRELKSKIPPIDILIDDGGHTMMQQKVTFEELFDHVKPDGIYLCEDMHTSYWYKFGGGYRRRGTFIEYSKKFIDQLHSWHSRQSSFKITEFTKSVFSLHYYDSILVIEKRPMQAPINMQSGTHSFEDKAPVLPPLKKTGVKLRFALNKILMHLRLPNV
jgi:hypothetical protein